MRTRLKIVFLGLSITSSWGNGHATTYRALLDALARRGHDLTFLERDVPWYARHRDLQSLAGVRIALYDSPEALADRFGPLLRAADVVILGSYVPDALTIGAWLLDHARGLVVYYDIDTPVTLGTLERGERCDYVSRDLLRRYHLCLSFTGGPALRRLEALGARLALPLYCGVAPDAHHPVSLPPRWMLGYLGTYAADRQPSLERLLLDVARRDTGRFVVAGPLYPADVRWPANVDRIEHLPPGEHSAFYSQQCFTLNLTRADMRRVGYSPSVRLFEAAACGAVLISDRWPGLDHFFEPFTEVLPADDGDAVETYLRELTPAARASIGARARHRVLTMHTAAHRARTLEDYLFPLLGVRRRGGHASAGFDPRPSARAVEAPTKP